MCADYARATFTMAAAASSLEETEVDDRMLNEEYKIWYALCILGKKASPRATW